MSVSYGEVDVHSGISGKEDGKGSTDTLGVSPYLLGKLYLSNLCTIGLSNENKEEVEWRLTTPSAWCANVVEYLPHLQYAIVCLEDAKHC